MSTMTIKYTDGTVSTAETLAGALASIRAAYPNCVAYTRDGWPVDDQTDDTGVLVWADEASSENDDGSNAIAEITA